MKILVTGGCGFLGSNIAASYLEEGATVVIIDALFRAGSRINLDWLLTKASQRKGRLFFEEFDLADREKVNDAVKKHGTFDYVCHLGGQVAMTTSLSDPHRDFRTNALGTLNVLEAIRNFSPESLFS
jgi:CDP-paratose 2-epimerase